MNDNKSNIPKIIHYCWFGGKKLPKEAIKCIDSWKKYFPDYEIREWNESNFDVNCCDYVREAYQKKKWAFVSDYARFDILYKCGGIYFDTDVEVISPMYDIVNKGPFVGLESGTIEDLFNRNDIAKINPGLGMASLPNSILFKEIINGYNKKHFIKENGDIDISYTVCHYVTDIIKKCDIEDVDGYAYSIGFYIYPKEYFCPKDYETGFVDKTSDTRTIHHYSATWISPVQQRIHDIEKTYIKKYGVELGSYKSRKATFAYRVINKIENKGIIGTIKFVIEKLCGK